MKWSRVRCSAAIEAIEHPITGTPMPKSEFEAEFCAVLEEMEGGVPSDHFDFYFVQCDICNFVWRFRDDDAREDFTDAAIELGCLPTLTEYHEGETREEQAERKRRALGEWAHEPVAMPPPPARAVAGTKRCTVTKANDESRGQRLRTAAAASVVKYGPAAGSAVRRRKARSKAEQLEQTLLGLRAKLDAPGLSDQARAALEAKAARVVEMMDRSV